MHECSAEFEDASVYQKPGGSQRKFNDSFGSDSIEQEEYSCRESESWSGNESSMDARDGNGARSNNDEKTPSMQRFSDET